MQTLSFFRTSFFFFSFSHHLQPDDAVLTWKKRLFTLKLSCTVNHDFLPCNIVNIWVLNNCSRVGRWRRGLGSSHVACQCLDYWSTFTVCLNNLCYGILYNGLYISHANLPSFTVECFCSLVLGPVELHSAVEHSACCPYAAPNSMWIIVINLL